MKGTRQMDIDTLERAFQLIFSHLREIQINSVEVDKDFYWDISSDERYDPYQDPKDLSLGQLSSDWEEIQKIASGEKKPTVYTLVWLSSLLRFLGENKSR
jgi:hypothetical protein